MIFYHGKHPIEMVIRHAHVFGISGNVYHLKQGVFVDIIIQ